MTRNPVSARLKAPASSGPASVQYAALCWRLGEKGPEVLLISSRDTGRWVVPKGWPMARETPHGAAATEAWEEAGIEGRVSDLCLGVYSYDKVLAPGRSLRVLVAVYPLAVRKMRDAYPEQGQRKRRWFSPAEAATKVAEPELAALISRFQP